MTTFFPADLTGQTRCAGCQQSEPLGFEFDFAYQPITDLGQGKVFAREALVRGPNGESAMSVLSQVTDSNRYRFDQLCRTKAIATAAALGMQESLSINFLPNAVYRPELCIRSTLAAAREHGFPLERLIFETVETEHVSSEHLTNILREYQQFGFKTAIDDFGAGHSGLTLLAEFQPDLIKLDMALIRHIDQDRVRRTIVSHLIDLCGELGIQVVAEGVETIAERDCLRDLGIDLMQGYLFAKPAFKQLVDPQHLGGGH